MLNRRILGLARAPMVVFAAMGILWGTFAADLPDLKTMLGISDSRLGLLLFMTPIAAMATMLAAPMISARLGRMALPLSALTMAAAFVLPGQVAHWGLFALAMLACGAGTGATDVLMNARAAAIEAQHRQPLMTLCHAAYSFGYATGALGTGALRSAGLPPPDVMPMMALLAASLIVLSFERDGRIEGLTRPYDEKPMPMGLLPLIGGGIVLIAFMTENAAESWSALHIERNLNGSPTLGAAGPAILALTMGFSRLLFQGMSGRIQPVTAMLGGATVSALGALIVAAAISPVMAYLGFITMGIGSSVLAPMAFSQVGALSPPQQRTRAIARTTLLGYFGYFIGPPTVGAIAGTLGLPAAFVFAAAMLCLVWLLAPKLKAPTLASPTFRSSDLGSRR
ncbi:MAG: MFS transporter [Alphaproteobacteria bacterium]